jgi:hypothetical protein
LFVGIVRTGLDTTNLAVNFPIAGTNNIVIVPNGTGGGTITITGPNGQTQTVNVPSLPYTIKDSQGRIYVVKPGTPPTVSLLGQQQPLSMSNAELNSLAAEKGVVTFLPHGFYAFDAHNPVYEQDVLWRVKYQKIGEYGVPRKAAAPGKPDVLKARIVLTDNTLRPDSVRFMNSKGMSFKSRRLTAEPNTYEIDIVGGPGSDAQEIYALHPKLNETGKYWSLGKILIASYTPQKRKMKLVPVNGVTFSASTISDSLNLIYKPIGVEWEVAVDNNFVDMTWDANGDQKMQIDDTGLWSSQTIEMNLLKKNYAVKRGIDPNTIYIFVLNEANKPGALGDMPRAKQFGYVFVNGNAQMAQTVAHEAGHGVFHLKHTFDSRYNIPQTELRNNLMNYFGGNQLTKFQWDAIHEPGVVIAAFDRDEDVMSHVIYSNDPVSEAFADKTTGTNPIAYYSFLTCHGSVVSIPIAHNERLYEFVFAYGSMVRTVSQHTGEYSNEISYEPFIADGYLSRFIISDANNNKISYFYNFKTKKFHVGGEALGEQLVSNPPANVVTGFIFPMPCGNKFTVYKFPVGDLPKYPNIITTSFGTQDLYALGLFATTRQPISVSGTVLKQTFVSIPVSNSAYAINEFTALMTESYCETRQLIYVDKIAQIRGLYPQYFREFTQADRDWLKPVDKNTLLYPNVPESGIRVIRQGGADQVYYLSESWPWGRLLKERYSQIQQSDLPHIFYRDFIGFIDLKTEEDRLFWSNLTESTAPDVLYKFIRRTPTLKLEEVDIAKRQIAFKLLMNYTVSNSDVGFEVLKIFSTIKEAEVSRFMQYVEQFVKIQTVEAKFRHWFDNETYIHVMTCLSQFIRTEQGHNEAYKKVSNLKACVSINSDLANVNVSTGIGYRYGAVINGNTITFNVLATSYPSTTTTTTPFLVDVPYDQLITVEFLTPFQFGDKRYPAGVCPTAMPAIFVAALLTNQDVNIFDKKVWLTVDAATLVLGIGELKLAIKTASWTRAAFAATDIAATAANMAVQITSDNTISPETKRTISIICAILQAPAAIRGVSEVVTGQARMLDEVEEVIRSPVVPASGRNVSAQARQLLTDFVARARQVAADFRLGGEVAQRIKKVAVFLETTDANIVIRGINAITSSPANIAGFRYVAIHAVDSKFKIVAKGIEEAVSAEILAKRVSELISYVQNDKIILLSCNDVESSQKFADAIGEIDRLAGRTPRVVISWEGEVEVFENGLIKGYGKCREFSTNGVSREIITGIPCGTGAPIADSRVLLGKSSNELKPSLLRSGEEANLLTRSRNLSGSATGSGSEINGRWLRGTDENAGLFPKVIADRMRGRQFNNFDDFRRQFWIEVANEPSLAGQFKINQVSRMSEGLSPFTRSSQQLGQQQNYILHHKKPIYLGGGVYDFDNLYIVTPRFHKEILLPSYHYGYGY